MLRVELKSAWKVSGDLYVTKGGMQLMHPLFACRVDFKGPVSFRMLASILEQHMREFMFFLVPFMKDATAHSGAHFGQSTGPYYLSDVTCGGSEASLFDCTHSGIGVHSCSPGHDAAVTCDGN